MNCLGLIEKLPLPTLEQTARFADHVANNHSWYKHLPFFPPGASFVFFLNPHAGKGVSLADEPFVVYEIDKGDYFSHHSRLATAEYFDRFGHWDYWVDDNPRVAKHQDGPWLYGVGGSRSLFSKVVREKWSCRFTAFLKPAPPMLTLRARELGQEVEEFWAYARQHPLLPEVARYDVLARQAGTGRELDWEYHGLFSFMEAEVGVQRERLLQTLWVIREALVEFQRGGAEPL